MTLPKEKASRMVQQQGDTPFGPRMLKEKKQGGMHLEDHHEEKSSWQNAMVWEQASEIYTVGASIGKTRQTIPPVKKWWYAAWVISNCLWIEGAEDLAEAREQQQWVFQGPSSSTRGLECALAVSKNELWP